MAVFADYARYYDLLYRDKDYPGEADYIDRLVRRFSPGCRSLLELGAGTGRHAALLAEKGYTVHGVEVSEDMAAQARELSADRPALSFACGDIRSVRAGRTFDAVISLFHVISYMSSDEDLSAAFGTARAHLEEGGSFIFDCWYGPAVLTERPTVRIKRITDEDLEVTRLAEPAVHPNENIVDVNYRVFVRERETGAVHELEETHRMRYLFLPEIRLLLEIAGFNLIHAEEWMTAKTPGFDTWGVCFVAKAVARKGSER